MHCMGKQNGKHILELLVSLVLTTLILTLTEGQTRREGAPAARREGPRDQTHLRLRADLGEPPQ